MVENKNNILQIHDYTKMQVEIIPRSVCRNFCLLRDQIFLNDSEMIMHSDKSNFGNVYQISKSNEMCRYTHSHIINCCFNAYKNVILIW